jgi:hypothetical protein
MEFRHIPAQERGGSDDLESRIGGKWFSRVGIVALLISVSYFLKLAFDNDWIGPSGRVAIGANCCEHNSRIAHHEPASCEGPPVRQVPNSAEITCANRASSCRP